MRTSISRTLAVAVLLAMLLAAPGAQAVEITFQVRMSYQIELGNFDPGSDFVDLAGTFNGWGTDPLTPLADADGDTIYEVTLGGFTPSESIEYKFRINGQWDGTEEFPGLRQQPRTTPCRRATTRSSSGTTTSSRGGGYDPASSTGGTTRSSTRSSCAASTTATATASATSRA